MTARDLSSNVRTSCPHCRHVPLKGHSLPDCPYAQIERLRAALENIRDGVGLEAMSALSLTDARAIARMALSGDSSAPETPPEPAGRALLDRFERLEGSATAALKWLLSADPLNSRHAIDILCIALHTTEQEFAVKWAEHIIQPSSVETSLSPGANLCHWSRCHQPKAPGEAFLCAEHAWQRDNGTLPKPDYDAAEIGAQKACVHDLQRTDHTITMTHDLRAGHEYDSVATCRVCRQQWAHPLSQNGTKDGG